jgi:ATP-dependent Clp protease adaptor protein ClpS
LKSHPTEKTHTEPASKTKLGNPWITLLFNDEVHSFDEVILQIQKATGCSLERAAQLTLQVHQKGKAAVYFGPKAKCEKVAAILGQIGLTTQIEES